MSNRFSSWAYIGVVVALLVFAMTSQSGVRQLFRISKEVDLLEKQNRSLRSGIFSVRQQIERVKNDRFFLEKSAREELALSKPGEIVYIISRVSEGDQNEVSGNSQILAKK